MSDKVQFARVIKPGVTLNLVAGAGNSQVCEAGEEFPLSALPDHLAEALVNDDPYTLESFELFEKDAPKKASASAKKESAGSDGYDPTDKGVKDVTAYLKTADAAEIKRVQKAEKKGAGRATILNFKPSAEEGQKSGGGQSQDSSRSGEPSDGYDDLDEAQVLALLGSRADDEEFVHDVIAYEASHDARPSILTFTPTPADAS